MDVIRALSAAVVLGMASVHASALPVLVSDELVSGELSSLHVLHVVMVVEWPAQVRQTYVSQTYVPPWISVADASSWPTCALALALMIHELLRIRAIDKCDVEHSDTRGA